MKKKYKKMQLGGGFLPPISLDDMMDFMSNLSIPQKLATKAVTGKYQTPSEAMGIKNKAGAFATDMILDPVNLIGAGLMKNVAVQSTKTGVLSKAHKLNPYAGKLDKYNRIVGSGAVDDALESGLVRVKTPSDKVASGKNLISLDRRGTTPYPSFGKGDINPSNVYLQDIVKRGDKPYIISTDRDMRLSDLARHGRGSTLFPVDQSGNYLPSFPVNEANIYEATPHWLKGYKQVKGSKNTPQHSEEIVRGPINWWDEPTFKKNNPNITGEQYINNVSKYGRHTVEPVEALTPFDMRTLSKEQYKDFMSKERLRTRTYNNPFENFPKKKKEGGTTNPTDGGQNSARSSTAKERESWNKFYKYMYDNKIAGSKDLDLRDKSLGMSYLDKFNQLNPEYKVNPEFIKIAQQEAALLKQGMFPEVNSTLDFPLNQYKNKQLSPVDGWLGSITSSQISYPTIQKSMGDGTKRDFGYDYAAYKAFLESEPRATAKLRKGGPVVDPMGQWAHPGKHTIVPTKSGNITMQGVPYPVFGKDETGYSQMMMPGGEYNFPGKTVYEIPMKKTKYQTGGSIVDTLKSMNKDASFSGRAALAKELGISNYRGTAEQNTQLLRMVNTGEQSPIRTNTAPKQVPQQAQPKSSNGYNKPMIDLSSYNNYKEDYDSRNLESGVITDKGKNMTYVLENGKVVKEFKVLTGKNRNVNVNYNNTVEYLHANPDKRGTPTGVYKMDPRQDIYGAPGFMIDAIPAFGQEANPASLVAYHNTYDPANRDKLYNMDAEKRRISYGCINCKKPDIKYMTDKFPQGDTAIILDTKNRKDQMFMDRVLSKKQQGGQMYRDFELDEFQVGNQVNLFGASNNFAWNPFGSQTPPLPAPTGQPMYRVDQTQGTPVAQQPIVPIQQGKGPGQWVPKTNTTWEPNVEAASMVTGGMGMIADQMNKIPDSRIYNNQVNRATSDASYQTYNPTLKRGYIDQNSGRMAPTNQTLTQFGNAPAPNYYGNLPIAQMGGLPDMGIPDDPTFSIDALVDAGLPSLPSSYMPTGAPSSIPSLAPSKVNVDDAEFLTYMAHQQGEAGIKALTKAARSGQDWREFYKGKENLDTNMRSNINPQEFFKKYDALNAGNFLDYWKGKFNKQSSKWSKKSTQYDELINEVAPQFGFSPAFVKTVVGMESSFDANASSGSHKGLLQLNEKEARKKGVNDVYNPVQNLMAGLQMMAQKRDRLAKMQFKEGGEYDLSLEEVNRLRKLGYDLEEIS